MRKILIFCVLFILAILPLPAAAKQAVEVVYGETYLCGDSFEVIVRGEPVFTTAITRSPGGGKTLQLKAKLPSGTLSTLTWKSDKPSVAKVSSSGKVTALQKGTATVTVRTANGKKATVKIKAE